MHPQSFRSILFIVFATIGSLIALQAQASSVPRPPQIDARGYLLMDAASGNIIVEHNADQRLPPASLTKMMTAYIAEAELQKGN
ncbi:MAG: D-alanyl-D-alanine carboxypeptidase, partial [Alcanivorax sp.]|nr:D-alanyl-D-alanine carboxypeptidase [Alcanivorax sp.]